MAQLGKMYDYCTGMSCRHRALVEYFGQALESECSSCDVCRGEIEGVQDAGDLTEAILDGIRQTGQRFGAAYVSDVLTGSATAKVKERGHHDCASFGALQAHHKQAVRGWIEQLVGQEFLERVGEYNVLQITGRGNGVLTGVTDESPRLLAPTKRKPARRSRSKAAGDGWEGVDRELFEVLRELRRELAAEKGLPPYMVFGDASLRDMARLRPSTEETLHYVRGVGQRKAAQYGEVFLSAITNYCENNGLAVDVEPG